MPRMTDRPSAPPIPLPSVRLDLWLWAARFFRTRSLARQAVDGGKVDVGGQRAKPARPLRSGDRLQITRGDEVFDVEVLAVSDSRGPAMVAQALYRESEASALARAERRAESRATHGGYRAPQGKPDKRARRLIHALGDIDAA